jgi:histidyl-tRNA synthetase
MSSIQSVKGTRDFYPDRMVVKRWLYDKIRSVSRSFGYQEFEAPLLERFELYAAKSGEELVNEQSFVFDDRSGERIVLRPELTPSLARMVAAQGRELQKPVRWWSFGPFWRYERPQRGRAREFFQWNIDLIGVDSPFADAEIVAIIATFFRSIGLTPEHSSILINNRRLVDTQLKNAGFSEDQRDLLFRFIDRRDKLDLDKWRAYGGELSLSDVEIQSLEKILGDKDAWKKSPELTKLFSACDSLGISEYLNYDPTVIRGLDYYTGTVFEARDISGSERAILGGGRYDNLVADVGGEALPGVGFAMGDVVIQLVLETNGLLPSLQTNPAAVLVTSFDETLQTESLSLARDLRDSKINVEWYPTAGKLNKQLKYANNQAIPYVCILGPDEFESGTVTLKNLSTGEQEIINRDDLLTKIQSLLEPLVAS